MSSRTSRVWTALIVFTGVFIVGGTSLKVNVEQNGGLFADAAEKAPTADPVVASPAPSSIAAAPMNPSVSVTPDGSSGGSHVTGETGQTTSFTVFYDGDEEEDDSEEFDLDCRTSSTMSCSVQSSVFLDPGQSTNVTVTYSTGSVTGSRWLYLDADGATTSMNDTGSKYFTVTEAIEVTDDTVPSSVIRYTEGDSALFDVKNKTGSANYFYLDCDWGGGSCTVDDSVHLTNNQTKTVKVDFNAGEIPAAFNLSLTAWRGSQSGSDTESVTVDDYVFVNATAERTPVYAEPSTERTDTFVVRFPGQPAESFDISVTCTAGITTCPSTPTDTLVGDTLVEVPVTYTPGANGSTDTLTLTATNAQNGQISASNTLEVVATSAIILTVDDANHGMELNRSECLNVAAGPGGIVCDDFQFVYPITSVLRMNRPRQTGLLYNSDLGRPRGVIGANFVLPPGETEPDSILATLTLSGTTVRTQMYPKSSYERGEKTRIAFDWDSVGTGVGDGPIAPSYDVSITPYIGLTAQSAVSASGVFVDVAQMADVAKGWWIAGVQRLDVNGDTLIWMGGDASVAAYIKSGTKWVRQTRARPDTITQDGSNNYIRALLGGGEIHFTSTGLHKKTVDRNGNETLFNHTGTQLTSIQAPIPSGQDTIYKFSYDGTTGGISKVEVRAADGGWDAFNVYTRLVGGDLRIDSIVAPDGLNVSFVQADGVIDTIFGAAGDTTAISYAYHKVLDVTIETENEDDVVLAFQAASIVGRDTIDWRAPIHTAGVSSRIDGPISGLADTTRIFVTEWGAVRGTRDALGNETWIEREDANYPGLPTRVRYPSGHEVQSVYDSEGLLDYTLDRSTSGLTDYAWDESVSRPDTIVSPEGVRTVLTYDSVGNMLTQKVVGSGTTTFTYDGDGLVRAVSDGLSHRDTMVYDSKGNLSRQESPLGAWTSFVRDSLGRVTETISQIEDTDSLRQEVTFDVMGRVTHQKTSSNVDALWTEVQTTYDAFGRRETVEAFGDTVAADSDSLSTGLQQWGYDDLGRVAWSVESDKTDTMEYDLAGRVTEVRTDRSFTITMEYDDLGRLTKRVLPRVAYPQFDGVVDTIPRPEYTSNVADSLIIEKDSVLYTYDEMGNALTINNRFAQITRTYLPNGALATDQQVLREYGDEDEWGTHVYKLAFTYNRDGQRLELQHPDWLSPGTDITSFAYDSIGRIATITGPLGDSYGYTYNSDDMITDRSFPGSGNVDYGYNADHQLTSHEILLGADTVRENSTTYRDNGTIAAISGDDTKTPEYTGLGAITESQGLVWEGDYTYEGYVMDPFGAQKRRVSIGGEAESDSSAFRNTINGYGRVTATTEEWASRFIENAPTGWNPDFTTTTYDASGNREYTNEGDYVWDFPEDPPIADLEAYRRTETKSFYSADNVLMMHQVNQDTVVPGVPNVVAGTWGRYEEYWYDGLGRRVLKYSRQEDPHCEMAARCRTTMDRIVWDGSQILWELRLDDTTGLDQKNPPNGTYTGEIGYINAGDVDAPIGMMRNGSAIMLHQTWRGLYSFSTDSDGDYTTCTPTEWALCPQVRWPGGNGATFFHSKVYEEKYWYGSVVMNQMDATGLAYRRNRYYDAASGQFTQQDPIGMAGGMNLYGYAGGDPINFSDPFGLCKEEDEVCEELVAALRANSSESGDVFAVTAEWLDEFDSGSVLIGTGEEYEKLDGRWGLAPSAIQGDGNLYINSGQGRGSQLVNAVHEVGHERGVPHGPNGRTMRDLELEAYNGLLPEFRATAVRQYEKLRRWYGTIVKRPGGGQP